MLCLSTGLLTDCPTCGTQIRGWVRQNLTVLRYCWQLLANSKRKKKVLKSIHFRSAGSTKLTLIDVLLLEHYSWQREIPLCWRHCLPFLRKPAIKAIWLALSMVARNAEPSSTGMELDWDYQKCSASGLILYPLMECSGKQLVWPLLLKVKHICFCFDTAFD